MGGGGGGGGRCGAIRAAGGAPQLVWTGLVRGPAGSARQPAHRMPAAGGAAEGGGAGKADGSCVEFGHSSMILLAAGPPTAAGRPVASQLVSCKAEIPLLIHPKTEAQDVSRTGALLSNERCKADPKSRVPSVAMRLHQPPVHLQITSCVAPANLDLRSQTNPQHSRHTQRQRREAWCGPLRRRPTGAVLLFTGAGRLPGPAAARGAAEAGAREQTQLVLC